MAKKIEKRRTRNLFVPKNVNYIDYKNVELLKKFINRRGNIIPAAASGLTAKQQRMVATAIKRARQMALLPFKVELVRR